MNSQLKQYIQTHKVSSYDFLVFRNWEEFLNILFSNNCRVEMIIWYEYCRINEQQIGMGGYRDEENSEYMWAETHLYEMNLQEKSLEEILKYIFKMRNKYSSYDLYPEFYIC